MRKLGIALIIIGIVLTLITSINFFTKKKVLDVGKIEVTKDEKRSASWSPLWGVGIIVIGGVLVMFGKKDL